MGASKRYDILDFWRFVFSCVIVVFHFFNIFVNQTGAHFLSGWIYVEFFFIITGYLTVRHFVTCDGATTGGLYFLEYPLNKIKKIYPYIIISVVFAYAVLLPWEYKGFFKLIQDFLIEGLLLSSGGMLRPLNLPIWYLSSLLFVLPVFCLLIGSKYRNIFLYYVSWTLPILCYGLWGVSTEITAFNCNLRAAAGLSLGAFVYVASNVLSERDIRHFGKIVLTVVEFGCFLLSLILTYTNRENFYLILISFVVGLSILFSEKSYSRRLNSRFWRYLGRLSISIYLLHHTVICFIFKTKHLLLTLNTGYYMIISFAVTVLLSVVLDYAVQKAICHYKTKVD